MTQNCFCVISDPNLKDVNEDVAAVVGHLMQKHGVNFKGHQHEKEKKEMERRIICKNKSWNRTADGGDGGIGLELLFSFNYNY